MAKLISSSFLVTVVTLGIFFISSVFTRQAFWVTLPVIIVLIWLCKFLRENVDKDIFELSLAVAGMAFLVAFGIVLTYSSWPVISPDYLSYYFSAFVVSLLLLLSLIYFIKIYYIDELEASTGLDKHGIESALSIEGITILVCLFYLPF